MYTLDEVIATLEKLRNEIGGEARFFMGDARGGEVAKADLYDIAGIYRTRAARGAVIMYMISTSAPLVKQIRIQQGRQTRARMVRAK